MAKNPKRRAIDKIKFSIGTKMVLIISFVILISLGSITALVSYLVSQDLRITAEANNFEVNRRAALEAENFFNNIKANTLVLVQLIHYEGLDAEFAADVFFRQNETVAALAFSLADGSNLLFYNDRLFTLQKIDTSLLDTWYDRQKIIFRVSQEINLINEADLFSLPFLTLTYPWQVLSASPQDEASRAGSVAALFSSESLTDSIGFGLNQSYLVNRNNELLVHSDFELLSQRVNLSRDSFIQDMRISSQKNLQTLHTNEDGTRFFQAYTKLNIGNTAIITVIEYDKVFEGITATTYRNMLLTVAVLSISILIIWFFAKSISMPLRKLAQAARQIEGGNFEISLKAKGKDEIGLLTGSFQKMSGALGIFGKFTNREIAILAMRGQIKPGGLPKHATIFFSDIRGFTQMSEDFTKQFGDEASNKIVFWLNEYLTEMVDCVEKTNGTIDKFIGDAVMAHWGTATTSGNVKKDALNCIVSALMMRAAVHKMNKARLSYDKGNPPISIGCGINTGMVTAGQIGSDQRMEYTVIGDAVNLASRIESLNKPLGTDILISENTWKLVKDFLITEEMPSVTVKGKEKPLRIFAVVNLRKSHKGPHTLAEVRNLLGIKPPESSVNLDNEEKKYKIAGNR